MEMTEEERMRHELQQMQRRADEVTDESLESTRRILRTAEETQHIGINTLVELDEQGEKLERVEENLDQINADMREAEKHLTGMEKFCGLCLCPCKRRKNFEKSEEYKKAYGNRKDNSGGKPFKKNAGNGSKAETDAVPQSSYIQRVTNDAREDEMDENLGQVAGIVSNLKSIAIDMGNEIESQNTRIDRITDKAIANEVRIGEADDKATKILRK